MTTGQPATIKEEDENEVENSENPGKIDREMNKQMNG